MASKNTQFLLTKLGHFYSWYTLWHIAKLFGVWCTAIYKIKECHYFTYTEIYTSLKARQKWVYISEYSLYSYISGNIVLSTFVVFIKLYFKQNNKLWFIIFNYMFMWIGKYSTIIRKQCWQNVQSIHEKIHNNQQ